MIQVPALTQEGIKHFLQYYWKTRSLSKDLVRIFFEKTRGNPRYCEKLADLLVKFNMVVQVTIKPQKESSPNKTSPKGMFSSLCVCVCCVCVCCVCMYVCMYVCVYMCTKSTQENTILYNINTHTHTHTYN